MTDKKKVDWRVSVGAIVALTILELAAMHYGINGTFRTFIFTAIAAIAGLSMETPNFLKTLKQK
jgi:hypothetical protein